MKYNLNNTPKGNLRIEFYNSLKDAGLNGGLMDMYDLMGDDFAPNPYLFKGHVSDCDIYPKQVKKLSENHPELLSVKISRI